MKVDRRSSSWEEGYDLLSGSAQASLISPPLIEAEMKAYRKELREKDARRKPLGFAAWPTDMPVRGTVSPSKATKGQKGKVAQGKRRGTP